MSYAIWPLPVSFDASGVSGGPQSNRITFSSDSGIPIERRRNTARVESWSLKTFPVSDAKLAEFEDWFDDSIAAGASPFVLQHPKTRKFGLWKIVDGSPPYTLTIVSSTLTSISFTGMLLPNPLSQSDYTLAGGSYISRVP
jgi:hypothetical protein